MGKAHVVVMAKSATATAEDLADLNWGRTDSMAKTVARYENNLCVRILMNEFEKYLVCRKSDEEGCPSYDGDSDSPGCGDGSTGEGV